MGKQKSFIIVGSVFLGLIVIILLVSLIGSGKDNQCYFAADQYYVQKGHSIDLAPELSASGRIKNYEFNYELDKNGIASVDMGTCSEVDKELNCWVFLEGEEDNIQEFPSDFLAHDQDDITIENGYWCINGESTNIKPEKNYNDEEITLHVTAKNVLKRVWMLNGEVTDIIVKENVEPTRNENGNWFIEGVDTGIRYKTIPVTIEGLDYGKVTLTVHGKVNGKAVETTTVVEVVPQDPSTITSNYFHDTIYMVKGSSMEIEYTIYGQNLEEDLPLQDAKCTVSSNIARFDNKTVYAEETGTCNLYIKPNDSSYHLGKIGTNRLTIKCYILESAEDVQAIEDFRQKIQAIGDLNNVTATAEVKAKIDAAREAYDKLSEELQNKIPFDESDLLIEAEKKYDRLLTSTK